jgi:galactokinase/mevalonate kinase-like predicted kinase
MDRIGDSAKKGFDFLKSRAKETVEVQKLSSAVKQLEERRQLCLLTLGHRVLEAYGTDALSDDIFRDQVEEVQNLTQEIDSLKREHEETKSHLRQSVEDLLPKRPGSSYPGPDYENS